jgi:hypothetical protein
MRADNETSIYETGELRAQVLEDGHVRSVDSAAGAAPCAHWREVN